MLPETLTMALTVIARNKGRSALTIVGLTIGVAAFIAVVSFGIGARTAVLSQFEGLGVNLLRVRMRNLPRHNGQSGRPVHLLTDHDVTLLRGESAAISVVVPSVYRTGIFGHGGSRMRGTLIATDPQYAQLQALRFTSGGMFDALDNSTAGRVCVLGAGTSRKLFADSDAVGQTLTIGARFVCRVVGVVTQRVGATSGSEVNEFVLLPARTFQEHIERAGYSYFDLRPLEPQLHEVARSEADSIMRRAHQVPVNAEADFDIVSPDDITKAADRSAVLLTGLLAAVACVSLLVGGIGIMNLQLVAVSERAQEIGIRAAIGAAPQQITRQFLTESGVLSGIGALIGVALGGIVSQLVAQRMGWSFGTPGWVLAGAGLFGLLVGIAFGYVPAQRAARLDPIQALREE